MNPACAAILLWILAALCGGEMAWFSGFLTACGFATVMRDS